MEDRQIVTLFWAREEAAIAESEKKYGAYCYDIAWRVLANHEDAQETLDDTWLRAWNAIPPEKPMTLRPFFAKLTRNLAIDRWRKNTAEKRGSGLTLALEELSEVAGDTPSPQEQAEGKALEDTIRKFLSGCTKTQRDVFLRRYFFFESTKDIAVRYAMRESSVLNVLSRTRKNQVAASSCFRYCLFSTMLLQYLRVYLKYLILYFKQLVLAVILCFCISR